MIPSTTFFAPVSSAPVSIRTVPAGAEVFRKEYAAADSTWIPLGRTPLDRAILSWAGGGAVGTTDRLRIQAAGYRTLELVGVPFDSIIRLDREDALPPEMVRVGGGHLDYTFFRFGRKNLRVGDFLMDRYEVTNREFKRFVDDGGYRRKELWEYPFQVDGKTLDWAAGGGPDGGPHRAARSLHLGGRRLSRGPGRSTR